MATMHAVLLALCVVGVFTDVSARTDAPAPYEGEDGVFEGVGEGSYGAPVFEGEAPHNDSLTAHAVPSVDEGEDGVFEGAGEGSTGGTVPVNPHLAGAPGECGGFNQLQNPDGVSSRYPQPACKEGPLCQEGLELSECFAGGKKNTECVPCGQEKETCCNAGPSCTGELQCLGGICGRCGGLREAPCPGDKKCEDGMVPRLSPPVSWIGWSQVVCQPPLECGSNPGAACCAGDDACFGSDGYGTPLTCIEGKCERCGLRGMVPCSDGGCEEDLLDVGGRCRLHIDPPCGLAGQPCCGRPFGGAADALNYYGPQCEDEGFSCDYGDQYFGDFHDVEASAPGYVYSPDVAVELGASPAQAETFGNVAAAPVGSGFEGIEGVARGPYMHPTCMPCGGVGQSPCTVAGLVSPMGTHGCNEGLTVIFSGIRIFCDEPCGKKGEAPCTSEGGEGVPSPDEGADGIFEGQGEGHAGDDGYSYYCPCEHGLVEQGGLCEPAMAMASPART